MVMGFSVLTTMGTAVTLVAQYNEKAGIILLSKVLLIYNIIAMLLLLPAFGLYGAAFARGSGQALKNVFIWWHVRHEAVWLNGLSAVLSGLVLWGTTSGVCLLVRTSLHLPLLLHLLLGAAICAVAMIVHFRTHAIGATDRTLLASLFPGKEARYLRLLGLLPQVGHGGASSS